MTFQPIGSEFKVDAESYTQARVTSPTVALAANGDFIAVWSTPYQSNPSDIDIKFRQFNADGTAKDSSDRIIVNSVLAEFSPAVAMAPDGSFVVAFVRETEGNQDVIVKRFNASGIQIGADINVDTSLSTRDQYDPAIALHPSGAFVVAWTDEALANDTNTEVRLRAYDSSGNPLSSISQLLKADTVNTTAFEPSVAFRNTTDPTAPLDFVATWSEGPTPFNAGDIFSTAYDSNIVGAVFQELPGDSSAYSLININTDTPLAQKFSDVEMDANGNFVVTWTHAFTSTDDDIRFRRFDINGNALSTEQGVDTSTGDQDESVIAMTADGRFVIAYENDVDDSVQYQAYNASGNPDGSRQTYDINSNFEDNPAIAINATGTRAVIVADDDQTHSFDPWARIFQFMPPPTIQFAQTSNQTSEGGGGNITLSRSGDTTIASQVQINLTGGTATAGTDYNNSGFPLSVTFNSGETTKVIALSTLQDSLVEGIETVNFTIAGATNAVIGNSNSATLQILDDDIVAPNPFIGDAGDNLINGDAQANTIDGQEGNDTLNGFGGNDIVVGGTGNDLLNGGTGNDTLSGGTGSDRFRFSAATSFNKRAIGIDTITDFTRGSDKIVLSRQTFVNRLTFATVKNLAQAKKNKATLTYIRKTGALFYNQNGIKAGFGTGGKFADLTDGLALASTDISIVK